MVATFHKWCVLPLAQHPLFLYQMTPEASMVGTRIRDEPVLATEIKQCVTCTVALELTKDF